MGKKIKRIIIVLLMVVTLILTITVLNMNGPFDPILKQRTNVQNYKAISSVRTNEGVIVYSSGMVNDGLDNMYFVDMVKKNLFNYKWLGGGGHIDRDIIEDNEDFLFSSQLLNENQNTKPSIFGIIKNEEVSKLTINTRNGSLTADIIEIKDHQENFYVMHFDEDVSAIQSFILRITMKDNSIQDFIITNEMINKFQAGKPVYFYE